MNCRGVELFPPLSILTNITSLNTMVTRNQVRNHTVSALHQLSVTIWTINPAVKSIFLSFPITILKIQCVCVLRMGGHRKWANPGPKNCFSAKLNYTLTWPVTTLNEMFHKGVGKMEIGGGPKATDGRAKFGIQDCSCVLHRDRRFCLELFH